MSSATVGQQSWIRRRSGFTTTRHQLVVVVILLAALVFYLWTAGTSSSLMFEHADRANAIDSYNLLTSALLHGHLYLPLRVPPGLIKLSDPYNPSLNVAYQGSVHDLLLYHGRFYSSWGPSSTLLFMLARITGWRLSNGLAVALYCIGGLAGAVAVLHLLARRFVVQMPDWTLSVATFGLALTNVAPFVLRRPAVYEVAISGGYCFEMGGLYLVLSAALAPRPRHARLAVGSLLFGLAMLARPPLGAGVCVLIAVAVILVHRGGSRLAVLAAALVPFLICLIAVAAYNDLRFGGAGDFGIQLQLAGLSQQHKPTDQLSYIPPGLFSYLLIPAALSLQFPHVFLQTTAQYPFTLPHGYEGTRGVLAPEVAGGMLPTMPITFLLLSLPFAWRRRHDHERPALLIVAGGAALTLMIMLLLAFALWGTTQRYEVDYATYGLLSAFLLWGVTVSHLRRGSGARRIVAVVGSVLTVVGAAAGLALSINGYSDLLQANHPATYDSLRDLTDPLVGLAADISGHPLLVGIDSPTGAGPGPGSPYLHFDASGSSVRLRGQTVTVRIASPRSEAATITALASSGSAPLQGQSIDVTTRGATSLIPIVSPSLRIPIVLRAGLNQVTLVNRGARTGTPTRVRLSGLRVSG